MLIRLVWLNVLSYPDIQTGHERANEAAGRCACINPHSVFIQAVTETDVHRSLAALLAQGEHKEPKSAQNGGNKGESFI